MLGVPVHQPLPFLPFDPVCFPEDISYGSAGGPEFLTEITELDGGTDRAVARLPAPRERWNIAWGVRKEDDVDRLMRFFLCRRGRAAGFYFQIPNDRRATDQLLGIGDGYEVEFTLCKTYESGGRTFTRSRLWLGPGSTLDIALDTTVTVDGEVATGVTLDIVNSKIVFNDAPEYGAEVRASFGFMVRARFDTDYLPSRLEDYQAESAEVPIIEIIPPTVAL